MFQISSDNVRFQNPENVYTLSGVGYRSYPAAVDRFKLPCNYTLESCQEHQGSSVPS